MKIFAKRVYNYNFRPDGRMVDHVIQVRPKLDYKYAFKFV